MATRDERLRENQRAFRLGNERLNDAVDVGDRPIPFLCECVDDTCTAPVEMSATRYADLHEDEAVYVVAPGHPLLDGELVVEDNDGYQVVRK